jgi:DNA-binding IclR family transcriptional regulator
MAAGIYDDSSQMVAGLSLSAPTDRLQRDWAKPLMDTALQISRGIGFKGFKE